MRSLARLLSPMLVLGTLACAGRSPAADGAGAAGPGAAAERRAAASAVTELPAGAAEAQERLAASPRHGEWAMIPTGTPGDSTRAWVVFPERSDRAPVVIVIHEIFGLSTWVRAVADQLAAEGFVAVAPDLLTRFAIPGSPDAPNTDSARVAIRAVGPDDMNRQVGAVAAWAMALPAALPRYGIVGFCWGGQAAFEHAVHAPVALGAAVVYYGTSPPTPRLAAVRAPVLGLYAGDDARVNATVPAADSALRALGRTFEHHSYPGSGHGFLRAQDGRDGANLSASRQAWPATITWFRQHLGG